jgi:hypothetical protein
VTRTWPIATLICVMPLFGSPTEARGQGPAPLSARAERALASLSTPSFPRALPGSQAISRGLFLRQGTCSEARAVYRASNAPLPPGARISASGATPSDEDVLVIQTYHGSSAIFFTDHPSGCAYRIMTEPSLQVRAPAGIPNGETFAPVVCTGSGKEREILASGEIGGKPLVIFVGQSEDEEVPRPVGRIVEGTLQQARARDEAGTLGSPWPAAVSELPAGVLLVTLASEAGPVRIRFDCTAGGGSIYRALRNP